jgi:hypothetical protein
MPMPGLLRKAFGSNGGFKPLSPDEANIAEPDEGRLAELWSGCIPISPPSALEKNGWCGAELVSTVHMDRFSQHGVAVDQSPITIFFGAALRPVNSR